MKLLRNIFLILSFSLISYEVTACHALALINPISDPIAGAIRVTASSNAVTCGCDEYWMDVEVRCIGEPFDGAPFNPGFHGPLSTYPYFQSAQILKPNCVQVQYPWVTIPYSSLCPGIQYQVRMRENHNGEVGPWTAPMPFTVPGTVDPLQVAVAPNNPSVCIGDCVTLTASVVGGCGLAPLYDWSHGGNSASTTVCPTVTTTYTVTVTEQCSNLTRTESITVNVLPTPVPGTASANPGVVCMGETANLSLTGHDGNIQWQSSQNPGGPWTNIPGATTANAVSPPLNTDMCFRAEVSGCGPTAYSAPVCVTVEPRPVLTISNATICEGQSTGLTSTVDIPGGTYLWTPTGQTTADLINVSPATTTTYNLRYILNGCEVNETGTVTVNPQPTILNLVDETICDGESTTITATPDVPGGNFTWTPNIGTTNSETVTPSLGVNTYTIDYEISGCTYSESVDITVNPVPDITIVPQEICEGETATLTATPDLPGGTYLWTPNGEVTQSISHTPANTSNYGVTYTLDGCTTTENADITVRPLPVASFTFTEVCEDVNTTLNSTSTVDAPANITNYDWDINTNGSIEYTNQNVSHDFNGYGTYDVNLLVTTNHGCTDQITQSMTVHPLPVIDFNANPLCLGDPTSFTDLTTVPVGGNITTWNWDFADGGTANTQNPQNTYATHGVYNVILETTTDQGCVDQITKPIEIFQLPNADFTFTNDCFYDDISFQNTSSPNATLFEWNFDDGTAINSAEHPDHLYANPGTYDVELIVNTIDGCESSTSKTVIAYAKPNAEFSVDPTCYNTSSIYTDLSSINDIDGDVINDWYWDFGDGNSATNASPTHQYAGENVYPTTLIVTSNFGCKDTFETNSVVWPLPNVNFTPTDVCLNFATEFNDISTISNQNTSNSIVAWNWDFLDGNSSTLPNPTHTYTSDGSYNVNLEVTSNNGCTYDSTIIVTVHPKPVADFTGTELTSCSPVCFNINSTSTVNAPATISNYEWELSDGRSYSSTSPNWSDCIKNNTGNTATYGVKLTVTTNHGCIDTHEETNYINVYHNPIANFTYSPAEIDVLDPVIQTTNNSMYADSYEWTVFKHGIQNEFEPEFEFAPVPEEYPMRLIASTHEGCIDTAFSAVRVNDRLVLYVPNTFTPDRDDYNETFQPQFTSGFDPYTFNMKIFNRWGEIVFESNNASVGWDGSYGTDRSGPVKDGTYIWKIIFKETGKDKRHVMQGHVNLLR
ncbi:hypothetical protein CW751_04415 [Brumimicrobium salinarum]|uniref:PKD domain-containing protein n=1 Tax=Brumimicrobium salinarum TaxID=2058658 RepID=A0A2I0R409_9FLAO|nr:PKD domain-containing protein [Brumimicrobium salinarum]PKR81308.1 hypothetical protein CW751_04415 [Brumimicrobium salinarum]